MDYNDAYFEEQGIPKDDKRQFLEYAIIEKPMTKDFIRKKNIVGALFQIEMTVPKYVARINESNAKKDSSNVNVEYDLEREKPLH